MSYQLGTTSTLNMHSPSHPTRGDQAVLPTPQRAPRPPPPPPQHGGPGLGVGCVASLGSQLGYEGPWESIVCSASREVAGDMWEGEESCGGMISPPAPRELQPGPQPKQALSWALGISQQSVEGDVLHSASFPASRRRAAPSLLLVPLSPLKHHPFYHCAFFNAFNRGIAKRLARFWSLFGQNLSRELKFGHDLTESLNGPNRHQEQDAPNSPLFPTSISNFSPLKAFRGRRFLWGLQTLPKIRFLSCDFIASTCHQEQIWMQILEFLSPSRPNFCCYALSYIHNLKPEDV